MRLSQIKLSGFKSFVEPTTIDIKGDCVAIVGPNGCGKSNVIDAVRWVLGESSAKQLRGESMQDVIFNGSTKRKPVSRATVELVFDNTEKGLSGLWNTYDEIAIKRLISRNGDSLYYINNQVVRRRDITELFLGTGVGTKGYAVIEQGMISKIIESKPEDLRLFLEEAAGVSKYREKRKESLSRLQDTRDNLLRLEDIQGELVKQIEVLQVQAKQASHYQDLQANLKSTQLTSILLKMDKASQTLAGIDEQIANCEKESHNLTNQLNDEEHYLSETQLLHAAEEGKLHEVTMEFNTLRTQLARLEERKRHNHELSERLTHDYNEVLKQIEEFNIQIEDLTEQITDIQEQINVNALTIEEKQLIKQDMTISFSEVEIQYQDANNASKSVEEQIRSNQHNLDILNNTKDHKKTQHANLTIRQKKLEQEMHGLDFNQGYFELQSQVEDLSVELDSLEEELEINKTQLSEYKLSFEQLSNKKRDINNQQISISTKINTLNELVNSSNNKIDLSKIIDNSKQLSYLYQRISVDSGYELAVEVALNNILSSIIIDDVNQIKDVPDSVFSVIFKNKQAKVEAKSNTLSNFVKLKSDGLDNIFTILNEFQVVNNFKEAIDLLSKSSKQQKIVTKDGHLLTNGYVIFNANTSNNHALEYQNQLEELNQTCEDLSIKLGVIDEELLSLNEKIDAITKKISQIDVLYKDKQQLKHKLQLEFTANEQIYVQTKNHHDRLQKELEIISHDISYIQDELTEIEVTIESQQQIINELSSKARDSDLGKLENETAYNLAKAKLADIDNQINQKIIDNQLLLQKINILKKNLEDKTVQIEMLNERKLKLETEKISLTEEQNNNEDQDLSIQIHSLALQIEEQNKNIEALNNKVSTTHHKLNEVKQNKERLQEKLNQLRLKEQEQLLFLHNQQEVLENLAVSEYDKDEILENNKYNLQELQSQVNKLQKEIEDLGLVNLKAIEDLEQITSKNGELLNQITDLTSGITQLEDAINQIDKETRTLMDSTYTKVCESFSVYFKTLFGGGTASLELTESDILNSGIQIFVQPPGKKNSSIHLLSGGEKALTAVSLIFALFNLNPAPFCLLDEVDAPLDDANTARFCNLVQELANNTQFVYISHNRLTMEMADQLVGVTMQEQGVSTTVSVSLGEAVKHAS